MAGWIVKGAADRHTADVVRDGALYQRDGVIVEIGPRDEMVGKYPDVPRLGSPDTVLMPGFVNSHHHVGLTPVQLGSPDHALELWFATRMGARDIDLYLDTLYSAFEMIASGVTTVQHIHGWRPGPLQAIHDAATRVLDAYRDIGMRASYSFAVRSQNLLAYEADAAFVKRLPSDIGEQLAAHLRRFRIPLDDYLALFDSLTRENEGQTLTAVQLAPANLHWCDDDTLQAIKAKADQHGVPMHMHLVETAYQKEYARRRTGKTAVAHLSDLGLLGPSLTLGHGVWLTEDDIETIAHTGTCICHNCSSNLRLRSGVAPLNLFSRYGVTVGMGLDEAGINDDRDMLQEMRLALNLHRTPGMDDDVPTCAQILKMASEHGAHTTPFGERIGRLEAGRLADVVLMNWKTATWPYQDEDMPMLDALMMRAKTNAVDAVMIGGEVVYRDGRFTHIDRNAVLEEIAQALARPRTEQELARRALGRAVFPHLKAFYADYLADELPRQPFYAPSSRI
ncbi:amidohydrolase family protein [Burkholderia multivorans]|uniref:amidohydrolase family protein n=1 Tax=Burkholderia multivorans TaxID=87883 RepID=UPI001ABB4CFF|nr:amidohydrolase family protein [Burkholderia multivorans]MBU9147172.1 amidohydrolase family protein [Burkholderia multivorans]MBU9540847.1 amidohydrolase family protein [Burkholderia multivorans]MDN7867724.1 amidohydrolase family protein [Burkholderia multivorans]MDN8018904.1 amidohydrolase family protein [Burkholderia multivorans]HEF4774079.1 amidohydrolase family protein [Burkholderia multivorans]